MFDDFVVLAAGDDDRLRMFVAAPLDAGPSPHSHSNAPRAGRALASIGSRTMANEELIQRGYLSSERLAGTTFGAFEHLNIGGTTIKELLSAGLSAPPTPASVPFTFTEYKPPKKPANAKPDAVYGRRVGDLLVPVAVGESKAPGKLKSDADKRKAAEQALFSAAALGASIGITSDGANDRYVDVEQSLKNNDLVYFAEVRDLNPGVLDDVVTGGVGTPKDPKPLAESVWQTIWHATKAEPKECLLTFVEIFVLKFLSDNLPKTALPDAYRFYALMEDTKDFQDNYGKTAIEYYVDSIRPKVKSLFPDNTVAHDPDLARIFGLATVVSKTSVINGFAFLKTSTATLASFNRTFREILQASSTSDLCRRSIRSSSSASTRPSSSDQRASKSSASSSLLGTLCVR